jgi:hypothetical protein
MPFTEARVVTDRSGRYLVQLCRHVSLVARTRLRMQTQVEWSDDRGVISTGSGRCTPTASSRSADATG